MGWSYHNKPPMGWPIDGDKKQSKGLVGLWLMNEGAGNKVQDLSGNRNAGTIGVGYSNESTWGTGKFGPCISLPSQYGRIELGSPPILIDDSHSVTVNLWVNVFSAALSYNTVFETSEGMAPMTPADATPGLCLFYTYNTSPLRPNFTVVKDSTDYARTAQSAITVSENTLHMITGVWDYTTKTAYIYVNGRLAGSNTNTNVTSFAGSSINIGGFYTYGIGRNGGYVDIASFYNRALSASDIQQLYREPFCMFKDPDEIPVLDQYYTTVTAGMSGAMTTNTGYWGW